MIDQTQKKLLLALDGSEYAQNAVKYVSELAPFQKMNVVLFNVFSNIPESYRDLEKDPQFSKAAREVMAWEMQQKKMITASMDKAQQTLIRSGFPKKALTVKIQNRIKGIARDIIYEAQNGYNAVVVGRKGMGTFQEVIVGSVAIKVVEKLAFLPILMIGQMPADNKVLMALDSSENAMQAVNFVADTLGGFDFKITLFHAIRGSQDFSTGIANLFLPKESSEEAEKTISDAFEQAKQRLIDKGFKPEQITTKIVSGVSSRAGAVVEEARAGDYRTIVIGRRGLTKVQEFFMGRVSKKIIQTIRNRAVWVVT
ncbi:MAG: universal stress protein [Proteobacteria bacterium]|nr:universal stress protein [Pseudomonadota bacterium]